MGLLHPYVLLGVLVAFLGFGSFTAYKMHKYDAALCQNQKTAMIAESQQRKDNEAKQANRAAVKVEKTNAQAKLRHDAVRLQVDDLVAAQPTFYAGDCLDAEGLKTINNVLLPDKSYDTIHPSLNMGGAHGKIQGHSGGNP